MLINRPGEKMSAKSLMREQTPSVYIVAFAFLAITFVISIIYTKLSGMDKMLNQIYTALYAGAELTYEDMLAYYPGVQAFPAILMGLLYVFSAMLSAGFTGYCFKASRRQAPGIKDIFSSFDNTLRVLGIIFLSWLFTLLWSLLLIVPGIIAKYRYSLAIYVHYDHPELTAMQCIRESCRITSGYKSQLFVLDLSFIGWAILGNAVEMFFSIPALDIWLNPYIGLTKANFYNRICGYQEPANTAGASTPL